MQTVSFRQNLYKMSNTTFWEKLEKYFKMSSAEFFTQYA